MQGSNIVLSIGCHTQNAGSTWHLFLLEFLMPFHMVASGLLSMVPLIAVFSYFLRAVEVFPPMRKGLGYHGKHIRGNQIKEHKNCIIIRCPKWPSIFWGGGGTKSSFRLTLSLMWFASILSVIFHLILLHMCVLQVAQLATAVQKKRGGLLFNHFKSACLKNHTKTDFGKLLSPRLQLTRGGKHANPLCYVFVCNIRKSTCYMADREIIFYLFNYLPWKIRIFVLSFSNMD